MASPSAHRRQLGNGEPLGKCQHPTIAHALGVGPVSAIGFGAMGLSPYYGAVRADDESRSVVYLVGIVSSLF
jgi:hypothetical protein